MDGDDPDHIIRVLDYQGGKASALLDDFHHALDRALFVPPEGQVVHPFLGDDDELGQVDGIGAFPEDHALRAALPAPSEEGYNVLKISGVGIRGEHLFRVQRFAVPGEDVANFALGDGHQGGDVNVVLDWHEIVQAAAQHIWLVASFPLEWDEAPGHGALAKYLFNNADPVIGNEANAGQKKQDHNRNHHQQNDWADRYTFHRMLL
jgi:hypothetical protein